MSQRRQLLVLVFLLLLAAGLAWALLQRSPCVPVRSGKALALTCMNGYEPRERARS